MRTFVLALVAVLLVALAVRAAEQRVSIRLADGRTLEGELLDFGERTYRVRVGGEVLVLAERDVVEIEFLPAPAPAPTLDIFPLEPPPSIPGLVAAGKPERLERPAAPGGWAETLGDRFNAKEIGAADLAAVRRAYVVAFRYERLDAVVAPEERPLFRPVHGETNVHLLAFEFDAEEAARRYLDDLSDEVMLATGRADAVRLYDRLVTTRRGAVVALIVAHPARYADLDAVRAAVGFVRECLSLPPLAGAGRLPAPADWDRPESASTQRRARLLAREIEESRGALRLSTPELRVGPVLRFDALDGRVPVALDAHGVCFAPLGEAPPLASPEVLDAVLDALARAGSDEERRAAIGAVRALGPTRDFRRHASRLLAWLEGGTEAEVEAAVAALETNGDPALLPHLLDLAADPSAPGDAVARLLWRFGDDSMRPRVLALLDDPRLRERAFVPLVKCGTPADHARVLPHARWYYEEGSRRAKERGELGGGLLRLAVLRALAERVWNPAMNAASLDLLRDGTFGSTVAALVERTGDPSLIPALERLADDPVAGEDARRLIEHFRQVKEKKP